MSEPLEVLCVGHASWDIIVRVPAFPAEDTKVEATGLLMAGGGPAANAAVLLAKWGVRVGFAGLVGDDDHGRLVAAEFAAAGVDTSLLEVRPGHATPVSVIHVSEATGTRTIATRKSAAPAFEMPPSDSAGAAAVLLFDGHEPAASFAALAMAPAAATVLDAGSVRAGTVTLAEWVDHLVASERFARQLLDLPALDDPDDRREAVSALYDRNRNPVVVTLGKRGLVHGTPTKCEHVPAFPVEAVDTLAAGDVFHGAFAYGLLRGLPREEVLQLASAAAALSVTRPGGRSSIPTLEETRAFLSVERPGRPDDGIDAP